MKLKCKLKCKFVGRKGYACENCSGIIIIEGNQSKLQWVGYGRLPKDCPFALSDPTKSDKVEEAIL